MILEYENKKYVFEFEHELFEEPTKPTELPFNFREGVLLNGVTQCHLTIFDHINSPAYLSFRDRYRGLSWCSYQDTFSKSIGRKISLTRILESFPKDFRTFVWKMYWGTHKKDPNDTRFISKGKN